MNEPLEVEHLVEAFENGKIEGMKLAISQLRKILDSFEKQAIVSSALSPKKEVEDLAKKMKVEIA